MSDIEQKAVRLIERSESNGYSDFRGIAMAIAAVAASILRVAEVADKARAQYFGSDGSDETR